MSDADTSASRENVKRKRDNDAQVGVDEPACKRNAIDTEARGSTEFANRDNVDGHTKDAKTCKAGACAVVSWVTPSDDCPGDQDEPTIEIPLDEDGRPFTDPNHEVLKQLRKRMQLAALSKHTDLRDTTNPKSFWWKVDDKCSDAVDEQFDLIWTSGRIEYECPRVVIVQSV
jgi:hypothetical protein